MTRVPADWLALREDFDAGARNAGLTRRLATFAAERAEPLSVVDLGSGTGANFRYLATRLPCDQSWVLVDVDPDLLGRVEDETRRWAHGQGWTVDREGDAIVVRTDGRCWTLTRRRLDLVRQMDRIDFDGFQVVMASALTDLVSPNWFDDLAVRCRNAAAAVVVALSYDGRRVWTPRDADDEAIVGWFNRHQRRDAGFGPALGPAAVGHMHACLSDLGYRVLTGCSDWRIGPKNTAMHRALIEDAARPCRELVPQQASRIEAWAKRRHRLVEAGGCRVMVGHVDLLALP